MVEPLSILTTVLAVANYLLAIADKVQQNRDELRRLAPHSKTLVKLVQREVGKDVRAEKLDLLQELYE